MSNKSITFFIVFSDTKNIWFVKWYRSISIKHEDNYFNYGDIMAAILYFAW